MSGETPDVGKQSSLVMMGGGSELRIWYSAEPGAGRIYATINIPGTHEGYLCFIVVLFGWTVFSGCIKLI